MCVKPHERAPALRWEGNGSDDAIHYDSLMTQLVDLLGRVRIAEKVRMGLLHPCVAISASAMFVVNQRVIRLRGMVCGITRVPLTRFTRSWDRVILTGNNTWVDPGSDPMSCSRVVPVPVGAGIACHACGRMPACMG